MKILVTGHAGFIGFHTAARLLERGDSVVGVDNVGDYYDPALKEARLQELGKTAANTGSEYVSIRANIADRGAMKDVFGGHTFDRVIHLAAQPGVRHSLVNPHAYTESNIEGFLNILEGCRHAKVPHLTYASSSSVYGANTRLPLSEHQGVDHPLALYAATKRANELMAHSYSHLYRLPTTGLRFFTVYGPWGRPDMAFFIFTRSILAGEPIRVFSHGKHTRDFTYVDDIVEGVIRASDQVAGPKPGWDSGHPDPATSQAPFRIFNIGNSSQVELTRYIDAIEAAVGRKAIRELAPAQPGDVADTLADVGELERAVGYRPATSIEQGVERFVRWYREFYRL
ncbi:MAG: NAD-dependent epimerase [Woeseiaceae bacterium]